MITIVPFEKEHMYELIKINGRTLPDKMESKLDIWLKEGICYSLFADGQIIASGGIITLWDGVGEAWTCLAPYAKKHTKTIVSYTKRIIDDIVKARNYFRVHAYIDANNPLAIRYIEFLGFTREGLLRRYMPAGTDAYIYSVVK